MRNIWLCTKWNIRALFKSSRILMCLIMGFLLCFLLTDFTVSLSQKYQTSLQLFEPFIWCFADADSILYASLVLMFLLAGIPRLDSAAAYFIFRIDRRKWILSQILTIFILTIFYCAFLLACTTLLSFSTANLANAWSDTATLLSFSNQAFQTAVIVSRRIVKVTLPYDSLLHIFILLFQYVLLAGFVQLSISIWASKKAGVLAAMSFHAFGYLLTPDRFMAWLGLDSSTKYLANLLSAWFSPLQHSTFMMHNFGYDQLPKLWQSHAILGGFCLLLIILAYVRMRKYNFMFEGDGLYVE